MLNEENTKLTFYLKMFFVVTPICPLKKKFASIFFGTAIRFLCLKDGTNQKIGPNRLPKQPYKNVNLSIQCTD